MNQTVEEAPPATSKAFNTFKSIKEKSNLLKSIAGDVAKACRKSITKPIPFSFEERDKQRIERKNLLINKVKYTYLTYLSIRTSCEPFITIKVQV